MPTLKTDPRAVGLGRILRAPRDGLRYDLRLGRHSGFPWCCVLWYSLVWAQLSPRLMNWANRHFYDGVDYVRCPACRLRGRKALVHWCDEDCVRRGLVA